jgi:hypothetical protein
VVDITDEAVEYIKTDKNAGAVTVELYNYGGCVGNLLAPAVSPGVPFKKERYHLKQAKGIEVYVHKNVETEADGIKIYIDPDPYSFNWLQVSGLIYSTYGEIG